MFLNWTPEQKKYYEEFAQIGKDYLDTVQDCYTNKKLVLLPISCRKKPV